MVWTHHVVDTITGDRIAMVEPASGSWKTVLNGVGSGSHSFHLRAAGAQRSLAEWDDVFEGWMRTLVVCWNDVPRYAGVFIREDWDADKGILSMAHEEIRTIFARRLAHRIPTWTRDGEFAVTGKTLRAIARAVIERGTTVVASEGASARWELPFVYPADQSGGASRVWKYWAFSTIEDMLTEIQDADGGPDVAIVPEWDENGRLRYRLELGSPSIAGTTHEFVTGTGGSPVVNLHQIKDAKKQVTGVIGLGAGEEHDMLVGFGSEPPGSPRPIPLMDTTHQFKALEEQSAVTNMATSMVRTYRDVSVMKTFDLVADSTWSPSTLQIGDTTRLWTPADERMAGGWVDNYVVSLAGDLTSTMSLGGVQ